MIIPTGLKLLSFNYWVYISSLSLNCNDMLPVSIIYLGLDIDIIWKYEMNYQIIASYHDYGVAMYTPLPHSTLMYNTNILVCSIYCM